jgi:3-deoxy-D-manno-octulosonic acid kinase
MEQPALLSPAPGWWIIHDPAADGEIAADWFDPQRWQGRMQPLDSGGRAPPHLVQTPLGPAVWRHYHRGGLIARLSSDGYLWNGLTRSRPWREFQVLQRLYGHGLSVPRPLAAQVRRRGGVYRGDLMTAWLADSESLARRWQEQRMVQADWEAVGTAIGRLHAQACDHADLNAHNVLFDPTGQVWIIDFDRACFRPAAGAWCERNLARLQRSLSKLHGPPAASDWELLCAARARACSNDEVPNDQFPPARH